MELRIPTAEQAQWGLRAMKTVALADGALDESERQMLEAVQRVFGTDYRVDGLDTITPEELAAGLPDQQIRNQLVNGLVVMSLIDREVTPAEAELVERFASALHVSLPEVTNLRHVVKREIVHLRLDLVRRFWLREKVAEIWNQEGLRGLAKFVGGLAGTYENAELAARYQALAQYPAGSLGRSYWEYCRSNGFALPGERNGAPEAILFHDCAHILSGYGTDPQGEVQVACFSAGFQRRDPFLFVFFVLLQFHLGIRMTPITKARTGFFDPELALLAIRRGAAMTVDLNHEWDYWPVMREPVEVLRQQYNILPMEAFRHRPDAAGTQRARR